MSDKDVPRWEVRRNLDIDEGDPLAFSIMYRSDLGYFTDRLWCADYIEAAEIADLLNELDAYKKSKKTRNG